MLSITQSFLHKMIFSLISPLYSDAGYWHLGPFDFSNLPFLVVTFLSLELWWNSFVYINTDGF